MCYRIISLLFLLPFTIHAQVTTGLVIGDKVNLRQSQEVKGKVITQLNGINPIEIIEVSDQWDALGNSDFCEKHKWVKIKTGNNLTGWVYGKFVFEDMETDKILPDKKEFIFNDKTYQLTAFKNFNYPPMDDEGLTGCSWEYPVFIKDLSTNMYYPVQDSISNPKQKSDFKLISNDGIYINIEGIANDYYGIIIYAHYSYQDGSAGAVYVIKEGKSGFYVSSLTVAHTID